MLEHALSYAGRGWPVIPCHPRTTVPLLDGDRAAAIASASIDEKTIREWWERWPKAAIGTPTGGEGGIIALKISSGKTKAGEISATDRKRELEEEIECELPMTAAIVSPELAMFYLFAAPAEPLPSRQVKGCELRGEGGILILPPSKRDDEGREYIWLHEELGAGEIPPPLVDLVLKRGRWESDASKTRRMKLAAGDEPEPEKPKPKRAPRQRKDKTPAPVEAAEVIDKNSPDHLREVARAKRRRHDPDPHFPRNGALAGKWTPNELGLPIEDPCPIEPLGINGRTYYFLDSARQIAALSANAMNHAGLQDLFAAAPNWVEWAWPRWSKPKYNKDGDEIEPAEIQSFKDDDVRKALFRACERKGLFAPTEKIRGRGAWKRDDGSIIYHAGDELWVVEDGKIKALECGVYQEGKSEFVYPRAAKLPPPAWSGIAEAENQIRQVFLALKKWNWEDAKTMPVLMLGWIAVAFFGGALDWRSAVFIIGDKGTGKSTLQKLVKDLFGETLHGSADTTAAGIYQALGQDSRPVAVDELEGSANNFKAEAVIKLARVASSGDVGRRGGSDHQGVEFQLRSAFLFSAIVNPPLQPQDLSRLALLRLRELPKETAGTDMPTINADTCGRLVLSRLMMRWHLFEETYARYRATLAAAGHDGRGQDTYGTLLACAELMLGDALAEELGVPMGESSDAWRELLAAENLPEVRDAKPNWRNCIEHLLTAQVDVWRGGMRNTVGALLDDFILETEEKPDIKFVKRSLAQAGLGIIQGATISAPGWVLAIPTQGQLVQKLFWGTNWQGAPGAGGWSSSLRMAPRWSPQETGEANPQGIVVFDKGANRVRINGVQERCTLIVLSNLDPAPHEQKR